MGLEGGDGFRLSHEKVQLYPLNRTNKFSEDCLP